MPKLRHRVVQAMISSVACYWYDLRYVSSIAVATTHCIACIRNPVWSMHASYIVCNTNAAMHCETCVANCDAIPGKVCPVVNVQRCTSQLVEGSAIVTPN